MSTELTNAVTRLEAVASRLENIAKVQQEEGGSVKINEPETMSASVIAFEGIISHQVSSFFDLSRKIGGDVQTQAELVQQAFQVQKEFLTQASRCKQPPQNVLMEILKPTSEKIQAIQDFREKNRRSVYFNHLSTISESVPALGWVTVSPTPGPFVKEMTDAGTFYSNRVLKDYKGKDQTHVDWTKAWAAILTEIQTFIKDHHRTGLEWNPQGGNTQSASVSSVKAPVPGPPAPPPPPPPPSVDSVSPAAGTPAEVDRTALMSDLNKGLDVTKGLKKVSDDMKTHKNPGLRQGPVPYKPTTGPKPYVKPAPMATKPVAHVVEKPPVLELQNRKWIVEYHKKNNNIVIDDVEMKQSVYVYKCEESTIQVRGKVNSITLDNCRKVGIVFDDVLASLEFVNCKSVQGQVNGRCPTVNIDKTDGCLIYLSEDSKSAEVITAKSSEMNILIPKGDGDYVEFPIPEQFKTIYNGSKMVTACTEL